MSIRQQPLPHRSWKKRNPGCLHQLSEGVFGSSIRRSFPKHDQRPLRAPQQRNSFLDLRSVINNVSVSVWAAVILSFDEEGLGFGVGDFLVQDVGGEIEVGWAGSTREGPIEDLGDAAGDLGDVCGLGGELGEGLHGGDLVELLEVSAAGVPLVGGAGDHDGGPGVGGGVGEACEAVDAAGAGDGEEDAGAAGEVAVGGGGVPGGLLVVEGDEADSEGDGAVGEGSHRDSHHAEHVLHSESGQRLCRQYVPVDFFPHWNWN